MLMDDVEQCLEGAEQLLAVGARRQIGQGGQELDIANEVRDAELDRLLTTLVQAPNPAAQITAAIAVQQNVASLRPYLPLWRRDNVLMMRQGVTGCVLSASGDYRGLTTCQSVQSR
jgi:hypothetical protein